MVKPVDRIVPELTAASADYITFHWEAFHPEASEHVDRTARAHPAASSCQPQVSVNLIPGYLN